ncbi:MULTISPECIES: VOC family protein [Bacillus]|uniref:VOC family protein n=1 Tax=Bacillus TaxID=1386 RepID=UPI00031CF8E4|nr:MULTISPECIES: VOC family protein [Bacillus]
MTFHKQPNLYIRDITINVSNLEQSTAFYTDLLGFKVLKRSDRNVMLTVDGINPMVILHQPDTVIPKQGRTTGLYHFAILLPSREELGSFLLHMANKNFRFQGASDHLVSEALYLADPDGNGIEVYHDRPSEQWVWKNNEVKMSTEPMDVEGVLAAGQGKEWKGMPNATLFGHIHLHVADLEKAIHFYQEVLGYDVVCRYGDQAVFISTGGYHHHIGLNTWNGKGAPAPRENTIGMKEFSIVIPNEEYKNKVIKALKALNISFSLENDFINMMDSSENHIRLIQEKE